MTSSQFAEQLDRQAETLDELLGEDGNHYPVPFAVAAATAVGLLRAAAAQWRDEHPDDSDGPSFGNSYLDETIQRITNAYRDGHRDGWLSCVGAMGIAPEDPDDPRSYEDAAQLSIPLSPEPGPSPFGPRIADHAPDVPRDLRRLLDQTAPRARPGTSGPFPGRGGG